MQELWRHKLDRSSRETHRTESQTPRRLIRNPPARLAPVFWICCNASETPYTVGLRSSKTYPKQYLLAVALWASCDSDSPTIPSSIRAFGNRPMSPGRSKGSLNPHDVRSPTGSSASTSTKTIPASYRCPGRRRTMDRSFLRQRP